MYIFSWNYLKEKWAHAGFQRYFKSTGWMLISKILCMVISFAATIIVTRRLGPVNFGQLSYALSFVGIFSFITSLGIDSVLYRDLIKYPEKKNEYLGSAFVMKMIASISTAIFIIIFAKLFAQDDVSKILIYILSFVSIFQTFGIIYSEFQARVKSKLPSIITIFITLLLNVLKVGVILLNQGVIYLALIVLLEPILYSTFYSIAYKFEFKEKITDWKFNKQIALGLLRNSWPMILTAAFSVIYSRIDQILIKHIMDAGAVGIYSSAVIVAEAWYFVPGMITASLFPAIVNAKKTSEKLYEVRLKKVAILLLVLSVGIGIVNTILAPFIINLLYGSAFTGGIIVLQIYVWSNIGIGLGSLAFNYLITENYRKIILLSSFVPMISNLVLNLIWIPRYGIAGSALATLISYTLWPLSLLFFKVTREKMVLIFKS